MNLIFRKQTKLSKVICGILIAFGLNSGQAIAQEMPKLQIGDPAPALTYSKWIQGSKPIKTLDNDKVYVLEFWATWCGPCIAAMPHLSELAKQYQGKIDFIGCDVWENKYGGPKEQESYTQKVTGFVADQFKSGRLTYNVIMDNNAEDMGKNWLTAAGQGGIPSSFVIDKGKIAWIGHPIYLDSILTAVVNGKYDYRIEKERKLKQMQAAAKREAGPNAAIKAYKAAEAEKNYDEALRLVDEAISKYASSKYRFQSDKFLLLMDHYSVAKAIDYGKELSKEKLPGEVLIANLYVREDLPKPVAEFAIAQVSKWKSDNNPKIFEVLAAFQAKAGHYQEAAGTIRKGIELGKTLKDNPAFTESTANEYEKKAQEYEAKNNAQSTNSKLYVGDKAPEFKYGNWLKGTPIKNYKEDHLYIFEFWATWCGPCIVSMPHLSEFAKANAKNVTVIAVNIWEDKSGKVAYESLWPKVTGFVKGMSDKMDFNVVTDTKDQHMGNNWMKAAGQAGIPCSFMVKNGVIQWIGHPIQIDSISKLVLDPKYNIAAEREKVLARANRVPSAEEKGAAELNKRIDDAIKNKQYAQAITLIDKAVATLNPQMAAPLNFTKFTTLLNHIDETQAMKFVKEWQARKPGFTGSVGAIIANTPGLSKDTYLYGIGILKELADNPQPGHLMYNFIAIAYANMNDYKGAVQAQEKAIAIGKQYLKDGKFVGFVLPDTITEYEAKLATYKSKIK